MINYANLNRKLKKASNIFVMGHKHLDLDAFGACVGIKHYCDKLRKKTYIIIEDNKLDESVEKAFEYVNESLKINFGKLKDFNEFINLNSLLIIVDTYSETRVQAPKALSIFKNVVIIDHHLFGSPLDENYFIDSKISSTCEIITEMFRRRKYKISKHIATILYGGIAIDSNNFLIKTTFKTLDCASLLLRNGANNTLVHNFSKTNMEEFVKIQKIVLRAEFYKKKYAFVIGIKDAIYDIDELAKTSDTLLLFNKVEASFTIGMIDKNTIGISARSYGIDVSKIMTKFGGGGNKTHAACQIEVDNKATLEEYKNLIKGELK